MKQESRDFASWLQLECSLYLDLSEPVREGNTEYLLPNRARNFADIRMTNLVS